MEQEVLSSHNIRFHSPFSGIVGNLTSSVLQIIHLEITDGKAQTEVIGTYNVNENVLTMNTSALENAEPTESGENYTYTLPESIPNFYFSDTTQGLLLYNGYLYVVTATTSGQTLEIINLKTGTLGGKIYYSQFVKEQINGSAASE